MRAHATIRSVVVILAAVTAGPACGDSSPTTTAEPTTAPQQRTPDDPAGKNTPSAGYIGVINARESVDVSAKIDGQVASIDVQLGTKVKVGEVIARLDDATLQAELAGARAAQRAASSAHKQAKVEVEDTQRKLDIMKKMVEDQIRSRNDLENAEFALRKAKAASDRAAADVAEHRARIQQVEQRLADAKIVAPVAGTVALRYIDRGTLVNPGTRVIRLISSSDLWVTFAVDSEDAREFAVGDTVDVLIEPAQISVTATVRQIAPELDPIVQMIVIEAELELPDDKAAQVRAGVAARVARRTP